MRLKLVGITLAAAVALLTVAPGAMAQKPSLGVTTVNLAGQDCTIPGIGDGTVTAGTLTLNSFTTQGGELAANVTVTATCAVGAVTQTRSRQLTVPIDLGGFQGPGSCEILDLVLGPLDLDLLGLVVHLDQVHLNITAERGPGNLLGNLLCALAGALDANAPADQIANLLNQILAILR
jgi:hypothetical protein